MRREGGAGGGKGVSGGRSSILTIGKSIALPLYPSCQMGAFFFCRGESALSHSLWPVLECHDAISRSYRRFFFFNAVVNRPFLLTRLCALVVGVPSGMSPGVRLLTQNPSLWVFFDENVRENAFDFTKACENVKRYCEEGKLGIPTEQLKQITPEVHNNRLDVR
jgi:hypothetical protein